MATTYKKTLKTISVTLHGVDTAIEVADTTSATPATNALNEFMAEKTMHLPTGDGEVTYAPFHAVISVVVNSAQSEDITRPDPVCEE